MKAEIVELWESGNDIIIINDNDCPKLSELKKCDNVIIGDQKDGLLEITIDGNIYYASKIKFTHPSRYGKLIAWSV